MPLIDQLCDCESGCPRCRGGLRNPVGRPPKHRDHRTTLRLPSGLALRLGAVLGQGESQNDAIEAAVLALVSERESTGPIGMTEERA